MAAARAHRLEFDPPHLLRDEREYDAAVAEIDELLDRDPPKGSAEFERLEFLSALVELYDDEHYPMGDTSTQQSVVKFMMEQRGMSPSDLAPLLGSKSRVSEFFSGKRRLSLTQIARLRDALGIPGDLLIELSSARPLTYDAKRPQAAHVRERTSPARTHPRQRRRS
jgi:HTH-type transcriptional regulator / antitoxin HigA